MDRSSDIGVNLNLFIEVYQRWVNINWKILSHSQIYRHLENNINWKVMFKSLYLKKSKISGKYIYYFVDKVQRPKFKKNKLKVTWCYFIDTQWPVTKAHLVELKLNKWCKVDSKLRRALNTAGGYNPNPDLRIIYCGDIIWDIIWE